MRDSVIELVNNIPGYYETLVNKYKELPEDSFLKSDIIKEKVSVDKVVSSECKALIRFKKPQKEKIASP